MTEELIGASAALASLVGLSHWARSVPTRAWGDGTPDRIRAWAIALGTMVLQGVVAVTAAGPTAGVALVIAAWMALGWLLVLAMNLWPQAALRWARRLGALGGAGCVVALGWLLVRG
ncbi:hypothetical protein C8C94_2575 [Acidovorax sp. 94]|uniref:hypothetical protein n=1 Tax=Acidovorax sp. 94 TaxID=2135633 RepID=UPI000EAF80FF|nr:hypothetical protein [Acidovorax sp. 94]RKR68072.1 hypothetical protein C8C94_2575 [Acidovorax sp. 94]